MSNGVITSLEELIALKRYARRSKGTYRQAMRLAGALPSKIRGRGMDFLEVRNYHPGDEIRHMEWRTTAKTGRPHVKCYQEERERPVVIFADFNPSMIFGTQGAFKSVIAARLAALFAWIASEQGERVGGFFFSATDHSEFMPSRRTTDILPLLSSLCDYTTQSFSQKNSRTFSDALGRMHRVIRPGSAILLISDFYSLDTASNKYFNLLRSHHDLLAYHVCDAIELMRPTPANAYAITDGSQQLVLDTRSQDLGHAYQTYCDERVKNLQDRLRASRIHYQQVTAKTDLVALAHATFARKSHAR